MTNPNKKPKGIVARRKPRTKNIVKPTLPTCAVLTAGKGRKRYSFVLPVELANLVSITIKQNNESANALVERAIRAELNLTPLPIINKDLPQFITSLSKYNWTDALNSKENTKESNDKDC